MYLTTFGSNRIYGFNKSIEETIYKCLNNHVAASYVIARRGLKYKELVTKKLKNRLDEDIFKRHHWKHWSEIKKLS